MEPSGGVATNFNGVDDVSIIHLLLCWTLRFLAPGTGTRRAIQPPSIPAAPAPRPPKRPSPSLPPHRSPYGRVLPLDGGATALVRPYLVTHERQYAQLRRRLALVLAADFGIDLDQHLVGATGWTA